MGHQQRVYVFQKIHLLNFPLAWLLARNSTVAARVIELPPHLSRDFVLLEYDDPDDWNEALEEAFHLGKTLTQNQTTGPLKMHHQGLEIDLSRQLLQHHLIELENLILTLDLAERFGKRTEKTVQLVAFPVSRAVKLGLGRPLISCLKVNIILDGLNEVFKMDFRLLASLIKNALLPSQTAPSIPLSSIRTIVRGIAQSEYAEAPSELDFSWWTRQGLLDPATTLFVLPNNPSLACQKYLSGNHWVSEHSLGQLLTLPQRLKCCVLGLATFLTKSPVKPESSYAFRLKLRARFWASVFQKTSLRHLISSLGESWPELPEVSIAQSLHATSINWAYAGSNFGYSRRLQPFLDLNLWRSIICADEAWAWNKSHSEVLQARQLKKNTLFEPIGPMMCGDSTWLALTPRQARAKFGLESDDFVYMAVFDIPIYKKDIRAQAGYGPYTLMNAQEALYEACIRALEQFPKLKLLIKQKRSSSPLFETPPSLNELLSKDSRFRERVIMLGAKSDPFIAIAMSDICLAAPFTSPVLVSSMINKPSFYYDGSGFTRHSFEGVFDNILLNDQPTLLKTLSSHYSRARTEPELGSQYAEAGKKVSEQLRERIKSRLSLHK